MVSPDSGGRKRGFRSPRFKSRGLRGDGMKFSLRVACAVLVSVLFPLILVAGPCTPGQKAATSVEGGAAKAAALAEDPSAKHGFDISNLDTSVPACTNFYQFAVGGWMAKNPIPPAFPSWGSFNLLADHNQDILREILDEAAKDRSAKEGSIVQKIGDYYSSCMNTGAIEAGGIKPLLPELQRIKAISDRASLLAEVAHLHELGVGAFFRFGSGQDFKNSSEVIGEAGQGGTGLPDRDYYTATDEKSKQTREAYRKHVTTMFVLLGDDPAKAAEEATKVMDIETKLAEASLTRVERRDPEANYHRMTVAEVKALTPDISWDTYLHDIGFPAGSAINVGQPKFLQALDQMMGTVSLADWKTYLRWHLIHATAPSLSSKFAQEDFDFFDRTLTGAKEMLPRWKICVRNTDRQLGEALGQKYVQRAFPPEAKARALKMVHNLIEALREDLATLPWMGPETRKQALAKLDAITIKIGYTDKWRDYSAYHVVRGPYLENVFRGRIFATKLRIAEVGKPVDRTRWGMTPPTVNAYYNPSMNEIVFPAGILQSPFYNPNSDDAINYGGIGAVIGHEMTHGFDDQGAKFDAHGNLQNWWSPDDLKNFQERAECVRKQFDGFVVEGDLHENGKLVLGESIADLGGLTIAHAAFEKTEEAKHPDQKIDGFTPEQRFFLAWAQGWAGNIRPEFARLLVKTNPHPLGKFRTNGPVSNMPTFADAYSCKVGDPMVRPPEVRCRIW
jgi:putative endopeptidase